MVEIARTYVICDIDNTLAAAWHRDELIEAEGWDAFHAASANDKAITEMCALLNSLYISGFYVVCCTGRPEKWRGQTMKWLTDHILLFHELWMRADDDYRPAAECKIALATERLGGEAILRARVALVLEDTEKAAEAWRALGVTVLLVTARRPE